MAHTTVTPLADAGHALRAQGKAELNVVFVHGFMGDALKTWSWRPRRRWAFWRQRGAPVVLPELLATHCKVPCHYYSVAHSANILSPTDIDLAAGVLRTFLQNSVLAHEDAPIVLIAHSFGGLACRKAVIDMLVNKSSLPVVGVFMLGTPNGGAEIARLPEKLGSMSAADMIPFNKALAELNRAWAQHVVNGGDPDLEADKRMPVLCRAVVGSEDRVVVAGSASSLSSFADTEHLNKSHAQLPKAKDEKDQTFILISHFLKECADFSRTREHEKALRTLSQRLRTASLRAGYVRREVVQIALLPSPLAHQFACKIVEQREGGTLGERVTVCVWYTGQKPAMPIDFDWEIGPGTMDAATFDRMVRLDNRALDNYFTIASLELEQGGHREILSASEKRSGTGWHAWDFSFPRWFDNTRPYTLLRLSVDTVTDDRQGWMFYTVARTVLEDLEVSFSAPFPFVPLAQLGKGATLGPVVPNGNARFSSRASVAGPVSIGRQITWIYDQAAATLAGTSLPNSPSPPPPPPPQPQPQPRAGSANQGAAAQTDTDHDGG